MRTWCEMYAMYLGGKPGEMQICKNCPAVDACKRYNQKLWQTIKEGRSILGFEVDENEA